MKFIVVLMLFLLAGCAQTQNNQPAVSGKTEPVNSPAIIQELTTHV